MKKTTQFNKANQNSYMVNRGHKSSLFCLSFRERKDLLELYNAINDCAIDQCIREDILKELLVKCREEVRNMVLTTFNRELYEKDLKAEGREEGEKELNILYEKLLDSGRLGDLKRALKDPKYLENLRQEFANKEASFSEQE